MDPIHDHPTDSCVAVFTAPIDVVLPPLRLLFEERQRLSDEDAGGWTARVFPVPDAKARVVPLALEPFRPTRALLYSPKARPELTVLASTQGDLAGYLGVNLTEGGRFEVHAALWSREGRRGQWHRFRSFADGRDVGWQGLPLDLADVWAPTGAMYGLYIGPAADFGRASDHSAWARCTSTASSPPPEHDAAEAEAPLPPPRHVREIVHSIEGVGFTGAFDWTEERRFAVKCRCGGATFTPYVAASGEEFPILAVECRTCLARHVLHDHSAFGYDARTGMKVPQGVAARPLYCSKCAGACAEVVIAFACEVDEDLLDVVDESEGVLEASDLYSWFFAGARCDGCGHAEEIASIECG